MTQGHRTCATPNGFSGGIGATNPAVERREASVPVSADGASLSAWNARRPLAPAGLRHWPADGCRCTRAPVGAPPPHCYEGIWQTSEELMPRENKDACLVSIRHPEARAQRASKGDGPGRDIGRGRRSLGPRFERARTRWRRGRLRMTGIDAGSRETTPCPCPPTRLPLPTPQYRPQANRFLHPVTLVQ